MDQLSESAELFYRRLMSRVDDHGRCEAHAELLRTSCYPLRVDRVKAKHIKEWIAECEKARLVLIYQAGGKSYLQLLDWRQQVRSDSKCPAPDAQMLSTFTAGDAQEIANEHLVVGVVGGGGVDEKNNVGLKPDALQVLQFLNEKTGKHFEPVAANLELIVARLKEGASVDDLRAVVAKKCREWSADEKMVQYLRPATLFNRTKFAQYRGELAA